MKIIKKMLISLLVFVLVLAVATFAFIQQASFGQKPQGEDLERISKSSNYKEDIFQNLEKTTVESPEMSYWKLIKMYISDTVLRAPQDKIPSVKNPLAYQEVPKAKVTWFGHSTVLLQMEGKNILIDPIFSQRASPVQYMGSKRYEGTDIYKIDDLPPIDFVLISHDHYDHLDYESIIALKDKVSHFYVPLGVGSHLRKWGVTKFTELDWWEEIQVTPEILVAATPARHFSGRSLNDRFKTLWTSYVIKSARTSIYFSGDSGYGTHFKAIGEKYGSFDLTMLETGQYNTFWSKIHMMPEETVQAHLDLKGKSLMPIHWGKFTLALHAWKEPAERISQKADKEGVTLLTPIIGEPIILDSLLPQKRWWETIR